MTDDPTAPTEEQKQAAKDVLADPDYIPEPDDPRDAETVDQPIEENQ